VKEFICFFHEKKNAIALKKILPTIAKAWIPDKYPCKRSVFNMDSGWVFSGRINTHASAVSLTWTVAGYFPGSRLLQ
jgi:hypothetical protein